MLAELGRAGADLSGPWPRVPPDVLADGKTAVDQMAAALRRLVDRLGESGDGSRDSSIDEPGDVRPRGNSVDQHP